MMKFSRIVPMVAAAILGLAPFAGHCQMQTYYYSGQVNGYTEVDLAPNGGNGGFSANFGAITETLYYDPTAGTLREVGTVTVNPSSGSFNINGSFFNPGSGSANLTVGNNGSFSFDDTCNFESPGRFDSTLLVPVSGSGTYDGQSFSGSWDIALQLQEQILAATPTSLTFNEFDPDGVGFGQTVVSTPETGLRDGTDDGTYYYSWNQDPVATAGSIPDGAGTLQLSVGALIALGICKYFLGDRAAARC